MCGEYTKQMTEPERAFHVREHLLGLPGEYDQTVSIYVYEAVFLRWAIATHARLEVIAPGLDAIEILQKRASPADWVWIVWDKEGRGVLLDVRRRNVIAVRPADDRDVKSWLPNLPYTGTWTIVCPFRSQDLRMWYLLEAMLHPRIPSWVEVMFAVANGPCWNVHRPCLIVRYESAQFRRWVRDQVPATVDDYDSLLKFTRQLCATQCKEANSQPDRRRWCASWPMLLPAQRKVATSASSTLSVCPTDCVT